MLAAESVSLGLILVILLIIVVVVLLTRGRW